MIYLILPLAGLVAGILIYRNNQKKADAIITTVEVDAKGIKV